MHSTLSARYKPRMAASSGTEGVVLGTNEYKVIIIGAVGVGKTSLLVRYVYNTFEESSMKVISEEKKKITISGQEVVLDLWDTAGMQRGRALKAHAAVCTFNLFM